MRAVLCEPGKDSKVIETTGQYEQIKEAVGGYIEAIRIAPGIHAYGNEEALLEGLFWNRIVQGHFIAGNLLVLGDGQEGEERGLTAHEARGVCALLDRRCVRLDPTRRSSLEDLEGWTGQPAIQFTVER